MKTQGLGRMAAGVLLALALSGCGGDDGDERERARVYAETVARLCEPRPCEVTALEHVAGDDWRVRFRNPESGRVVCDLIQLDRFRPADGDFAGVAQTSCRGLS